MQTFQRGYNKKKVQHLAGFEPTTSRHVLYRRVVLQQLPMTKNLNVAFRKSYTQNPSIGQLFWKPLTIYKA